MFGAVVLRDIPKEEVRMDLFKYTIQGGFRGFSLMPFGLHYISVKSDGKFTGFWFFIKPYTAIIKIFNYNNQTFEDTDDETTENFKHLALSGSMGNALTSYPMQDWVKWNDLVKYIKEENFPPKINETDSGEGSRFEKVFITTHNKNSESFLAEFQFAFVDWLVSTDNEEQNNVSFERWKHLVQSIYNAGESNIKENPELFSKIIETIIAQYKNLSNDWFKNDSFLIEHSNYLIEDMKDTGVPELIQKSAEFEKFMDSKKVL